MPIPGRTSGGCAAKLADCVPASLFIAVFIAVLIAASNPAARIAPFVAPAKPFTSRVSGAGGDAARWVGVGLFDGTISDRSRDAKATGSAAFTATTTGGTASLVIVSTSCATLGTILGAAVDTGAKVGHLRCGTAVPVGAEAISSSLRRCHAAALRDESGLAGGSRRAGAETRAALRARWGGCRPAFNSVRGGDFTATFAAETTGCVGVGC